MSILISKKRSRSYQKHLLRIHWRLSTILKISKKVYKVMFFDMLKYIFWKCIQYTMHWDKTQMLQNFPLHKINGRENALFSLLRAPTHNSFTFNLRFLYELKHKVRLSRIVCGSFHFQFLIVFISLYFCSTKCMGSLTSKRHNSFQN